MRTLSDLRIFLYNAAEMSIMEGTDPDIEAAIYWYALDWHEGQGSDLYQVLCESPYTPSPSERSPYLDLEGFDSDIGFWYGMLQDEFGTR